MKELNYAKRLNTIANGAKNRSLIGKYVYAYLIFRKGLQVL